MQREGRAAGEAYERGLRQGMGNAGAGLSRDASGRLRDERGRFVGEGRAAGDSYGDALKKRLRAQLSGGALSGIIGGALRGLAFAVLGAAAAAAAANIVQLVAALIPLGGLLLTIPAAGALAAASIAVLTIAFSGMGDAFGAALEGDVDKFNEALEKLSPAAQTVARDFRAVVPELKAIRSAVQDAFFGPLAGQLQQVSSALAGPLRTGLAAVAAETGQIARGFAEMARSAQSVNVLNQVLGVTRQSTATLAPAFLAIGAGVRDVIGAVVPIFLQISAALAASGVQFGQWLQQISASGQAFRWVENALATLRQLGDFVAQLGGILAAVFRNAQASGAGLLGTLTELLRGVNAFLSSAQGVQVLSNVFALLSGIGAALGPVITTLLTQLGSLFPIIGQIVQQLGPALQAALNGLGAGLRALGPGLVTVFEQLARSVTILAPTLEPVGAALGRLLQAVAPLLPAITQVASSLLLLLANALQQLLPVIQPVVDALADNLLRALPQLTPPLLELVTAIGQLLALLIPILVPLTQFVVFLQQMIIADAAVPALRFLASAVSFLRDIIVGAVGGIGDFVSWLGQLADATGSGIGAAVDAVSRFVSSIVDGFLNLPSLVGDALAGLGGAVLDALSGLGSAVGTAMSGLATRAGEALAALPGILRDAFVGALGQILEAVGAGIGLILLVFTRAPELIGAAWSGLGDILAAAMEAGLAFVTETIPAAFDTVIDFFVSLPGRVVVALAPLGAGISAAFQAGANFVTQTIPAAFNAVVDYFFSLPGRIGAALGGLAVQIGQAFTNARVAALGIVIGLVNEVGTWISSIPGRISAFGGQMQAAGQNLINSLMRGLAAAGGFVSDIASRITAAIRGSLNFVIDRLNSGIASVWPSIAGSPPQIPRLARGDIITRETLAILGEAGTEVVIPMTKPDRAVELAQRSGLVDLLARHGAFRSAPVGAPSKTVTVHAPVTVHTQATNVDIVARRASDHIYEMAQA